MYLEQATLEGFLSYKERQTIDFRGLIRCLVNGMKFNNPALSNGSGKSSLFESIAINFFGKTAGRSNLLDSYMNDDPSVKKMYIEHVFIISGKRYKKTLSKKRDSSAVQEVYFDTKNDTLENAVWRICDLTLEQILGLSIITWSSVAHIGERESLKFIDGTSSQRKEVFRELINIEIYENAAKKANKLFNEISKKIDTFNNLAQIKQNEINNEGDLETPITELEDKIKLQSNNLKKKEKEKEEFQEKKKNIEIKKQKLISVKEKYDTEISRKKEQTELLNGIMTNISDLNESIEQHELSITKNENKIKEINIDDIKTKIDELKSSKDNTEIKDFDSSELKNKIKDLKEQIKKNNDDKIKIETNIEEYQELKSKNDKELATINSNISQITKQIEKINQFGTICPVSDEQCNIITSDYKQKNLDEKTNDIETLNNKKEKLESKIEKLSNDIVKSKKSIKEYNNTEIEINDKIDDLNNKIETETEKISNLRKKQTEKNTKIVDDINSKEKELIQTTENLKTLNTNILNSQKQLEKDKNSLEKYKDDRKKIKEKLLVIEEKINELNDEINKSKLDNEDDITEKISELNDEITDLNTRLQSNKEKLIALQEKLKRLEKVKIEYKNIINEKNSLSSELEVLTILIDSFGKDGIQKVLMKQSVPLLEETANELLKIFNNGNDNTKIRFELDPKKSDGDLKKDGGLDILVCEEGKEPKDICMFSGGETIRLVFSIVFALARLLTKRSGKKHEMLILDEKVAKLDENGIEQFAEIMKKVYPWYKQVFVITHLSSLKDILENDSEIIVNKTENGSFVNIIK